MTRHVRSRPSDLLDMKVGDSVWFEVRNGQATASMMSQIGVDARRVREDQPGMKFTQKRWIAINPDTAETIVMIRVTKVLVES